MDSRQEEAYLDSGVSKAIHESARKVVEEVDQICEIHSTATPDGMERLAKALDTAVMLLESYRREIRHSDYASVEALRGINLYDIGFCQGDAFKSAFAQVLNALDPSWSKKP